MTMHEFLNNLNGEKAMRIYIYISRQIENCKEIEGAMSIYDLLNDKSDDVMIVAPDANDKHGYWFCPIQCCDIACKSMFVDGDWGYTDPDDDENVRFPFQDYGKTWAAIPWDEAVDADGWPKVKAVAHKLLVNKTVDKLVADGNQLIDTIKE